MPSSVIRRYSYDAVTRTLFVTFVSGETYAYLDVPEGIPAGLKASASKGRYFARRIRDRFAFRRMGPDEPQPRALSDLIASNQGRVKRALH